MLAASAVAWAGVVALSRQTSMGSDVEHALTMGMGPAAFIGMWALMMTAMMLPAAAPAVAAARRWPGVATFTAAYLAMWAVVGAIACALAIGAGSIAARSAGVMDNSGRIAGALFVLTGLYQVSPIKRSCLERCRGAVAASTGEPARRGIAYAAACVGCSWLLVALLLPLGITSVAAMLAITAVIVAERVLPRGPAVSRWVGGALVVAGIALIVAPALLPTQVGMSAPM